MGFLTLSRIRKLTEKGDASGLLEIVIKESDPEVKITAINSLGVIKATIAVIGLIEVLETEKRIDIRKAVAVALGKIKSPKAIVPLIEFLKKEQDVVWKIVEEALISINDPSIVAELEKIYSEKGNEYAKQCADNVIKHFKSSLTVQTGSNNKQPQPIKSEPKKENSSIDSKILSNLERESEKDRVVNQNGVKEREIKIAPQLKIEPPPAKSEPKKENSSIGSKILSNLEKESEKDRVVSQNGIKEREIKITPQLKIEPPPIKSEPQKIKSAPPPIIEKKEKLENLEYYIENIKLLNFSEIKVILERAEQFSVDEIICHTESEDQKKKSFAISLLGKFNDDKSAKKLIELASSVDVFTRIAAIVSLHTRKSPIGINRDVINLLFEPVYFLRVLVFEIIKRESGTVAREVTKLIKNTYCNYVRSKMVALLLEHGLVPAGSIVEVLDRFYKKDTVALTQHFAKTPNCFIELLDINAIRDTADNILFLAKVNVPVVTGYLANKIAKYEKKVDVFETLLLHFYLSGINEHVAISVSYLYNENEKLRASAAKVLLGNKWKPTNSKDYVAVLVAGNFWGDIEKKGDTVFRYMSHFMYFNELKTKIMELCLKVGGATSAEFLSNYFIDKDSSIQLSAIKSFDSLLIKPTNYIIEKLKLALYSDTVFVQKEALMVLEKAGWKPSGEKEEIICKIIRSDWENIRVFEPESIYSLRASLNNKSWIIRQKTIAILGDINYSDIAKDILVMVNDKEKQVQATALKVLVSFYENDSTVLSKYLLDDEHDIRTAAAKAVDVAEKKDLCDEALANAILNNAEFFKKSNNKQTREALLQLFDVCKGFYKEEVVSILLQIGWKPENIEQKILAAAAVKDFEFLEKSGNSGLLHLVSMMSDFDTEVSRKAIDTVIKMGKESLFYVMELLRSDLWSERKVATHILGKIQCDESLHALSELVFSEQNCSVKLSAIEALASFNSPDVTSILCDLCFTGDDSKNETLKSVLKFSKDKIFQFFLLEKSNEIDNVFDKVFELCSEADDVELLKIFLFSQSPKIRLQVLRYLPFLKRKGVEIKGDETDFRSIENSGITGYIPYQNLT